jgi:hypothetical protein
MNVAPNTCCRDRAILQEVLDKCRTARYLQDIAAELEARGVTAVAAKATIAWLLKYGMLRPHESTDIA